MTALIRFRLLRLRGGVALLMVDDEGLEAARDGFEGDFDRLMEARDLERVRGARGLEIDRVKTIPRRRVILGIL